MSDAPDIADLHNQGQVPTDAARPVNEKAQRKDEDEARLRTVRQLLTGAVERAHGKTLDVCTTGHYGMDRDSGGLLPGFVWVFGAETNWGKSSHAVMLADENIRNRKKRCLIVSSEDSESLYGDRLLCRRARVNANRLRHRNMNDHESELANKTARSGEDIYVFLDARGKSAEWAATQSRKLMKLEGVDLVLFDYLQAFDNQRAQQDRRNQLTYIARVLTDAIKIEGKTGVLYSQVTVQDSKPHPDKHSIRDSRDVSNAAEVVALGFTPENGVKPKGSDEYRVLPGQRAVLLDKVKNGTAKRFHQMKWDDHSACFDAVKDPEQDRLEAQAAETGRWTSDFERYP